MLNADRFYIGGEWVAPSGAEAVDVLSPSDFSLVGKAVMGSAEDADRAVAAARGAFESWRHSSIEERMALLRRMRAAFEKAAPAIAAHLVRETGLTTMVAQGQSMMSLSHFDAILDLLPSYAFSERHGERVELVKEPIGVVVAITSWNAPVSQMLCKAVPAIAAGCTVIVKPSEQAPLCGILLAEAMAEADIPPGVFNLLNGRGADCGRRLAEHPDVDMVSMTGSVPGGGAVAAAAAPTIKAAENFVVGPPDQQGVTMGPLSNEAQFNRVNSILEQAVAEGQPLLTGGPGRPDHLDTGYYARPTVFGPVAPDAFIAREEIFGPVLCIMTYRDETDAIRIANATDFGLSAYVESTDPAAARRVAGAIRAGWVNINYPAWTAAAPFGGYKRSGNGKQYGVWGFEEFLETKSIVI